jgi:hypothetical protein
MGCVRDRAGEFERLLSFLGDDCSRNRGVVFAGRDASQNAGPRQDLLLDLERRVFLQVFDQLVIEAGRLAILDELEGAEVVLGRNDQPALLDFVEACGLRRPATAS